MTEKTDCSQQLVPENIYFFAKAGLMGNKTKFFAYFTCQWSIFQGDKFLKGSFSVDGLRLQITVISDVEV